MGEENAYGTINAIMKFLSLSSDYFALDIGTTAMRLVQTRGGAEARMLVRYGSIPLEPGISISDSANHHSQLLEALKTLMQQTGVTTKNVVLGLPSNKVFISAIDFPALPEKELKPAIMYQADQFIPTSLDDSKLDWTVLGQSPVDPQKLEILLASVPKKYVESRLNIIESIGLNIIAMEPDAFALARSMVGPHAQEAVMVLDMGAHATDLIITMGGALRLSRSIPVGGDTLLKAAEQNLGVDSKQAMQFVYKFGLMQDKLEGQVFKALSTTVDGLIAEVEKSVKFFAARYANTPVSKIVVTGRASVLPEFPVYLVGKTNLPVEIGNAWMNTTYPQASYNDLMSVANQYGVAAGLAQRVE